VMDVPLWHKLSNTVAFCLFGVISLWLAYQIATGSVVKPNRPAFLIGAQMGLLAATMYVCIWIAIGDLRLLVEHSYTPLGEITQVLIAFLLNALWFGLLPAALAGGLTAMIIYAFFARSKAPLSPLIAAVVGAGICLHFGIAMASSAGLIFLLHF
jgi:hypothetical protein